MAYVLSIIYIHLFRILRVSYRFDSFVFYTSSLYAWSTAISFICKLFKLVS